MLYPELGRSFQLDFLFQIKVKATLNCMALYPPSEGLFDHICLFILVINQF